jgi:hypothetical protein
MRNENFVYTVVGIAMILVFAIGYAIFSESIEIKGTATASGSFDIRLFCETDTTLINYLKQNVPGISTSADRGYSNDSCNANNSTNEITFSVSLNYPRARKLFVLGIENEGDIPAIIQMTSASHTLCVDGGLNSSGQATGSENGTIENAECYQVPQNGGWSSTQMKYRLFTTMSGIYALKRADESYVYSSDFATEGITTTGTDIRLEPDEIVYIMYPSEFNYEITRNPLLIRDTVTVNATATQITAS